jgi:hypothetical protein
MTSPRNAVLAALVLLAACASPRERAVSTVEVRVPVAIPCDPKAGPAPAYPDTDQALKEAPGLFERVRLLLAGRELRRAREAELEAGIRGCSESSPAS